MKTWNSDELSKIGAAEELKIAPLRRDGTRRSPTTIWVVRVGDHLYVRAYHGRNSVWFRTAIARYAGRIQASDIEQDVAFVEESDPGCNDQIDAAYRKKYGGYGARYVDPMVAARATTLKLVPQ